MADIRRYFQASTVGGNEQNAIEDMSCPFCSARERDFERLQSHEQSTHSDQTETTNQGNNDEPNFSDAELAQLLAFEEAGIPSALALEDFSSDKFGDGKAEVSGDDYLWIDCFCGERVLQQDIDIHSNMHQAEREDSDDEELEHLPGPGGQMATPHAIQDASNSKPTGQSQKMESRRLGKSELGPYANEERMPRWLHSMLAKNVGVRHEEVTIGRQTFSYPALENETSLLVPKLQLISQADPLVTQSVFCSPVVNHVRKLFQEGGFCGYRNIQMLITYLRAQPGTAFEGQLPTIFELQDAIEAAWDKGIHAVGRIETGGIKNTRKYIGTSEAQAFFTIKGVACRTQAFKSTDKLAACDALLNSVRNYFAREHGRGRPAPIYLQYKGHSMTVVGFEELAKGHGPNLVIFDPRFLINRSLKRMSLDTSKPENKTSLLRNHRYSRHQLKRYDQFELVFLES
ncbi:hypothetical protein DV736_g797, partial [Chaetothyriales sp. CBS 134916]